MKKFFKGLAIVICTTTTMFSCTNNDDDNNDYQEVVSNKKANFKIVVENIGDNLDNFQNTTTIQVTSDDINNINMLGYSWDEVLTPSNLGKWFTQMSNVSNITTYQTSDKVETITYASLIEKLDKSDDSELITKIKIYQDDVLIKEVEYTTSNEVTDFQIPILASNF